VGGAGGGGGGGGGWGGEEGWGGGGGGGGAGGGGQGEKIFGGGGGVFGSVSTKKLAKAPIAIGTLVDEKLKTCRGHLFVVLGGVEYLGPHI